MPTSYKRVSRLHSKDPADAAWRAQQAQVDADIEGLARDPEIEKFFDEMRAEGITTREMIKRLKAYFRARQNQNPKLGDTGPKTKPSRKTIALACRVMEPAARRPVKGALRDTSVNMTGTRSVSRVD